MLSFTEFGLPGTSGGKEKYVCEHAYGRVRERERGVGRRPTESKM
jgi:hypothetical protein